MFYLILVAFRISFTEKVSQNNIWRTSIHPAIKVFNGELTVLLQEKRLKVATMTFLKLQNNIKFLLTSLEILTLV